MSKPRQVYLRQDILHVTFKGGLYAPAVMTEFAHRDKVVVENPTGESKPEFVLVRRPGKDAEVCESWVKTAIPTRKERELLAERADLMGNALYCFYKAMDKAELDEGLELEDDTNILSLDDVETDESEDESVDETDQAAEA